MYLCPKILDILDLFHMFQLTQLAYNKLCT